MFSCVLVVILPDPLLLMFKDVTSFSYFLTFFQIAVSFGGTCFIWWKQSSELGLNLIVAFCFVIQLQNRNMLLHC